MGLMEELESYRQPNGLYSNQINPGNDSSGNCIAITALAMWLAFRTGNLRNPKSWMTLNSVYNSIKECLVPGYSGLLNRSPTKLDDQEGWDDYMILTAAMARNALNFPICNRILDHGKLNIYCFNNVTPPRMTWQSFLGRYLQFIAHLHFCVAERPSLLSRIGWSLGVMFSSFSSDPSSIVINSMTIEAMGEQSWLCSNAASFWLLVNKKKIKKNVAKWLGSDEHPIVKYWEEKWAN